MNRKQPAFGKRTSGFSRERQKPASTAELPPPSTPSHGQRFPDLPSSPLASQPRRSSSIIDTPVTLPIQLTYTQLRPIAYRIFSKKHGLNLKTSGLEALAEFIGRRFGVEWRGPTAQKFMDDVAKLWKQEDRGLFIERDQLQEIIREVLDLSQSRTQNINGSAKQSTIINMLNGSNGPVKATREDTLMDPTNSNVQSILETVNTDVIAAKLARQTEVNWRDYYKIISSFDQPPYEYNIHHKQFELKKHAPLLLGPISSRLSYFVSRYQFLYDSMIRQEWFVQSSMSSFSHNVDSFGVHTPISSLKGRDGRSFIVFGMVTIGKNGKYWIQDPSGKVQVDIESAIPQSMAYYFPGSIVLVEGVVVRDIFKVSTIASPSCEPRSVVREVYGFVDFLGVHVHLPKKTSLNTSKAYRVDRALEKQLFYKEKEMENHRMYILGSHIYLDKRKTIDSLRKLFANLKAKIAVDSLHPVTFVLMGPFYSSPFQPNGSTSPYKDGMDSLAQVLSEYPELFQNGATLLLVPGDGDPWESVFSANAPATWPMRGIPSTFTNRVQRAAPRTELASNPCRVAYLSQEIQFVRDDLGERIRRNQIYFPEFEKSLLGEVDSDIAIDENNKTAGVISLDNESSSSDSEVEGVLRERDLITELEKVVIDTQVDKDTLRLIERSQAAQKALRESSKSKSAVEQLDPEIHESRKIVKTLLDQATLSPFLLNTRPVSWDYTHAISLTPLPTLVS